MKTAVIIGAGPAGLTAAYELASRANIHPIVLEKSGAMGGLAQTVNYNGNRIDIGGHRFFSKSDRVMEWWLHFLPLQSTGNHHERVGYQNQARDVSLNGNAPDPEREDNVMLIRRRLSRIYFQRKFFDYPIKLSAETLKQLGFMKAARIGASYARAAIFRRAEQSLEDFYINRFGRELYLTFFKSYTEKVWGVSCREISAEWGAQRVKGLSVSKTLLEAAARLRRNSGDDPGKAFDKRVETSLIEKFLYPKYGAGQMWECVAERIRAKGGEILTNFAVDRIEQDQGRISAVWARHTASGEARRFTGDYYFSTMPVQELVRALDPAAPGEIRSIADGLVYRNFIIVGMLCRRLKLGPICDNWIYIQEPDVLAGRIQILNNWSPYLVSDPGKLWMGVEYFCSESDGLWRQSDDEMIALARRELAGMDILDPADLLDAAVIRMPKAYPAYLGSYGQFPRIIEWADRFDNLFLIGRNGMHKYNNQDHSMLAAMIAVDNILAGVRSRDNLWSLNTEEEYHELKKPASV